ncbi:hypothetical protein Emag_000464 [Eimeria magna]
MSVATDSMAATASGLSELGALIKDTVNFASSAGASPGSRRVRSYPQKAVSVACQSDEVFEAQSLDLVLRSLQELLDANPFKQVVVGLSALRQTAIEHYRRHQEDGTPGKGQQSSDNPSQTLLDLSRVTFFLVDERYVPPTDSKSNVRLVMEELFGHKVCKDADLGSMKFEPTDAAWPYSKYEFHYPDTSLPLDQCIEKYRELTARASISDTVRLHRGCLRMSSGSNARFLLILADDQCVMLRGIIVSQSPLEFPALEVIGSGGAYVVSYPSLDDFSRNKRRSACQAKLQHQATMSAPDVHKLHVVVFGASGDLAKRKT